MTWNKLLLAFKNFKKRRQGTATGGLSYSRFDRQLLQHTSRRFYPSWSQLKYLGRFLTKGETKTIIAALSVSALGLIFLAGGFVVSHLERAPKEGGEYIEAMVGQPKFINPLFSSANDIDADITSLVYSGLFKFSQGQKLVRDIAAAHTVSKDNKTYDITLREDVKWSDGEPLTADDVIFTFEAIQNPEVGSTLLPAFQGVTVEKMGDYAVRFKLKEQFAPFLNSLTVGILPEHVWTDIAPLNMKLAKNNLQPVGTGPWVFSKLVKDEAGNVQSYTLARNPYYYDKTPYLKNLTFKFYGDYNAALDALRGQNVTALSFVPKDQADKIAEKTFIKHPLRLPQYTALFFNQRKQPELKDYDLRVALFAGTDRNAVAKLTPGGESRPIYAPLLPGMAGFYQNLKVPTTSADEANRILDKKWKRIQPEEYFRLRSEELTKTYQAEIDAVKKNPSSTPEMVSSTIEQFDETVTQTVRGEMNSDQTFFRQNKDGKILSLVITTADTPEYARVSEEIARQWRSLGIQTQIQTVNSRQIAKETVKTRDYQILLYGEIVGSDPDLYPFWHSSQSEYPGLNLAMFVDRSADKLLEDARATSDNKVRGDLYKKFQEILIKEMPAVFLYAPEHIFAVNKSINGIKLETIFAPSDRYNNLAEWHAKTKWTWKNN